MSSAVPALECTDLRVRYGASVCALDGVSFHVQSGEFVSVIGPNGSGKSTLLRTCAGMIPPDSGNVKLYGVSVSDLTSVTRAKQLALVPQNLAISSDYTVEDFVLLGRYAHLTGWRLFSSHDRSLALENLRKVDAIEFRKRGMDELSGGERQRVLIARALTQDSKLILLDEPTSALDLKHQVNVYHLIRQIRTEDRTVVVVTHDLNLASQFSDRLVLMNHGRIVIDGPPETVLTPEVLGSVYETELAFGRFNSTSKPAESQGRPWVLPTAMKSV